MKYWKKLTSLGLALALVLSLAACGQKEEPAPEVEDEPQVEAPEAEPEQTEAPEDDTVVRMAALKGPTGMGLAYLEELGGGSYDLTIAAKPDEVNPLLLKGELDVACVPANAAAVLNAKSQGEIITLGINTLGVLYMVEKGDEVQSFEDLRGKTIVTSGKGMTPEYVLRYLLTENGIDPDKDVTIEWKSEHSESISALATGAATVAMMPQPFVTVAQTKLEGLRVALDMTQEWAALDNGSQLLTGVVVARKSFVEEHTALVEKLLADYAASVEKVNADPAAAGARIGEMNIVDAKIAEKALPFCNIVCITGTEMKDAMSGYLQILFDADPTSVGGQMPGDDFYFGA